MKKSAARSQPAASRAEQKTHRRRADQIADLRRVPPARVGPAERKAIETDRDVGQIGPGIRPRAEKALGINPFRIFGAPQTATLAPAIPDMPAVENSRDDCKQQNQREQRAQTTKCARTGRRSPAVELSSVVCGGMGDGREMTLSYELTETAAIQLGTTVAIEIEFEAVDLLRQGAGRGWTFPIRQT